jgi:ankyrin repeat protein
MAAWKGHSDVVKRLVEAGADVNHRAKDGKTALLRAEQRGDQSMVAYLKEHGAT